MKVGSGVIHAEKPKQEIGGFMNKKLKIVKGEFVRSVSNFRYWISVQEQEKVDEKYFLQSLIVIICMFLMLTLGLTVQ